MKWQSSFIYVLYIALITRNYIDPILRMVCNVFSEIIYVLKFMFSDIFRTRKTPFILLPKPGEDWLLAATHVGKELPTSSCPAATALPWRDPITHLGWLSSPSLGEVSRLVGLPQSSFRTGWRLVFIIFMSYTCLMFDVEMLILEIL